MDITEVRVKLVEGKQDKLKAFCSITIDNSFVIRDLKVIEGAKGLFVAMPSRKITVRCDKCGAKNQIGGRYCSNCANSLGDDRGARGRDGRLKLHADIAHPINSECRETIQSRVLESFVEELEASSEPGYEPATFDDLEAVEYPEFAGAAAGGSGPSRPRFGFDEPPAEAAAKDQGVFGANEESADDEATEPGAAASEELEVVHYDDDFEAPREHEGQNRIRQDRGRRRDRGRQSGRGARDSGGRGPGGRDSGSGEGRGNSGEGRGNSGEGRGSSTERRSDNKRGDDRRRSGAPGNRRDRSSDRDDRPRTKDRRKDEVPSRRKDSGEPKREPRFREKTVETNNPPPDDNFGVGIF